MKKLVEEKIQQQNTDNKLTIKREMHVPNHSSQMELKCHS